MQFCSDWACEKMPLLMFFHSQGLYSPCRVIFTSNTGRCYQEIQQNSIFVNLLHTEEHVTSHNYLANVFFCKERNTFENFFVNYSCVLFECEAIFCFVLQPQTFWHKPFHIALIFPLTHTHMPACYADTHAGACIHVFILQTHICTCIRKYLKLWTELTRYLVHIPSHACTDKRTDIHAHMYAQRYTDTRTLPALSPGPYCSNGAQLQPMNIPVTVFFSLLPSLSFQISALSL